MRCGPKADSVTPSACSVNHNGRQLAVSRIRLAYTQPERLSRRTSEWSRTDQCEVLSRAAGVMAEVLLSPELAERHPVTLRGRVDAISASKGIVGWLVDLERPGRRHRMELLAGDRVIAVTETVLFRDDLGFPDAPEMTPGFQFPPVSLLTILETAPAARPERLRVRVADTSYTLLSAVTLYTNDVVELAEQIADETLPALINPASLLVTLEERRNLGRALLRRPFRPNSAAEIGFVEVVSAIATDLLLLIGWMQKPMPIDMAGVVIEGEKHAFGLAGFTYRRPDLAGDAVGFFALAKTAWRPSRDASFVLFWKAEQYVYLRGQEGWRAIVPQEAAKWLDEVEADVSAVDPAAIRHSLSLLNSWDPALLEDKGAGLRHGIDRVVIFPGFGALVEGWIISPWKQIASLTLRIGDQVMPGDDRTFMIRSRKDLATPFPDFADLVAASGFSSVFLGDVARATGTSARLRVSLEDGSAALLKIEPHVIRLCNNRASFEATLLRRTSIPNEPFFLELVRGFGEGVKSRAGRVRPIDVQRCTRAMIIALPSSADDMLLLFEEIGRSGGRLPDNVAIVILSSVEQNRTRILSSLAGLRRRLTRPVHLVEITELDYAIWSLESVLDMLGCERFWFVGPGAIPLESGWRAGGAWLSGSGPGRLTFFIKGPRAQAIDGAELVSLSFGWTAQAFREWLPGAPFVPSGFYRDNGLPSLPAPLIEELAIVRLNSPPMNDVVQQCDQSCYEEFLRQTRVPA